MVLGISGNDTHAVAAAALQDSAQLFGAPRFAEKCLHADRKLLSRRPDGAVESLQSSPGLQKES